VLVSDVADILPSFPAAFRARFHGILAARGIAVVTGALVTAVEPGRLMLAGYGPRAADEILWTTQAAPARWLAKAGLPLDARGFLRVDETLRVIGHDDVFAAGDTIAFSARELPKSGVYAVRARAGACRQHPPHADRPILAAVPAAAGGALSGLDRGAPRRRHPQRPRGRGRMGVALEGLDRSALHAQVQRAAAWLTPPALPLAARRPAGAQGDFRHRHALRRLRRQGRRHRAVARARRDRAGQRAPRWSSGLDAPDDAALVDVGGEQLSLQTVDYFRAIVDDPYMLGQDRRPPTRSATSMPWAVSRRRRWRSPPCRTGSKPRSRRTCPR
jgi:selenide,water dikinase